MRKLYITWGFTLLISLSTACRNGQDDADFAEIPQVAVYELIIVDSIGVELGDTNYVLGSIEAVSHSIDGNILALDRPACCVLEYSPEGEFLRRFGRRGTGPAEFANPLSMTRLTDGRIVVLDQQTGGLHSFSTEGEWEGVIAEITNEPILWITPADSCSYVGSINSFEVVDEQLIVTAVVGKFRADSAYPYLIYWENSFPFDFRDFTLLVKESYFATTWMSDRLGNVFIAPRDMEEYNVTGYDIDGNVFVEISLDFPMVEKSELEIVEEGEFWNERARNMGANGPLNFQPDPYRWKVVSMGIDADSRLWVRRGTEEIPTFDVFDYQGDYLFQAVFPEISDRSGLLWEIRIDEYGILAWSLDPLDGYQKLYMLELTGD